MGLFDKIKKLNIFSGFFSVDEDFYEELEENLILSDMGMDTTLEAVEDPAGAGEGRTRSRSRRSVKACLREILVEMLDVGSTELDLTDKPAVILMIGVNGVGKTTTIGKLANLVEERGQAGPAGCGGYLPRRRRRSAGHLGRPGEGGHRPATQEGADPAAVVFDAMTAAKARERPMWSWWTRQGGCTTSRT